jgi:hypothetical protein
MSLSHTPFSLETMVRMFEKLHKCLVLIRDRPVRIVQPPRRIHPAPGIYGRTEDNISPEFIEMRRYLRRFELENEFEDQNTNRAGARIRRESDYYHSR